ncbi:zinc finger MYM-type protein 2-like [Corticium candelabrum]|uniref:zinc finger MYM-type protein 2-like n=1 Tax=Corticium candelabrum TaxID=121492 RepID=UPI002E268AB8|nr:zinc finger MYM-type protein 2-like [Corticium candelabrum]
MNNREMNYWLARFMHEVRRQDGKLYPPFTMQQIVAGLQCSKDDSQFSLLRSALDARMKELTRQNVGTLKKHAQVVTADMETSFWEKGVFGSSSAQTLLDTLFFYSCKLFGMRSGDEH